MDMPNAWEGFDETTRDDDLEYVNENSCFKILNDWEQRRRLAAVQVLCFVVHAIHLLGVTVQLNSIERDPNPNPINIKRGKIRNELIYQLSTNEYAKDVIRMKPHAFLKLCEILRGTGRLHDNRNSLVEEQVAKFLWMLGHHCKNKNIRFFFR